MRKKIEREIFFTSPDSSSPVRFCYVCCTKISLLHLQIAEREKERERYGERVCVREIE